MNDLDLLNYKILISETRKQSRIKNMNYHRSQTESSKAKQTITNSKESLIFDRSDNSDLESLFED